MITDVFEYAGDEREEACRLRCKNCAFEFTANFNLLSPENVAYNMAAEMTMTVTCPACKASVDMDQREVNRLYLAIIRDTLRRNAQLLMADTEVKFVILDNRYSANFAFFHCLNCNTDFEARSRTHPDGPLNVEYKVSKDLFRLICPTCGAADEINRENGPARQQLSLIAESLRTVEQQIKELGEEDG